MRRFAPFVVLVVAAASLPAAPAEAQACLVPSNQIVSGGPGKDGIPALTRPRAVSASEGDSFLARDALVLGFTLNGEARAYPHNVLWWHEIVNDVVGGMAVAVSYCPLTGSGMVYDATIAGVTREFGVSGLLFDNNLILYDRVSQESLWSQMRVEGICGPLSRTAPRLLPVVQSTWEAWRALHPETTVVSFETGFRRNYGQYPYGSYDQLGDNSLLFPQSFLDRRRPLKELVLGIARDGVARAYPYGVLGERSTANDVLADRGVLVLFDRRAQLALAFESDIAGQRLSFEVVEATAFPFQIRDKETSTLWDLTGAAVSGPLAGSRLDPIATYSAMWFAWAAFHRETDLFLP